MKQRKSIRLKNYDYSSEGLYFVTLCVQDKAHLFGCIENGNMVLNPAGEMVQKQWFSLKNRFQNIDLGASIVMPNHLHGVVVINPVGAPLVGAHNKTENPNIFTCGKTENSTTEIQNFDNDLILDQSVGAPLVGAHNENGNLGKGQPQGISPTGASLGNIIGAFKSITTHAYIQNVKTQNWTPFNGRLWQRNYYEHIIRAHDDYLRIVNYITNNPNNWNRDSLR